MMKSDPRRLLRGMAAPRAALSLMAAAVLAGCAFTPAYERPAAPVPERYAQSPEAAAAAPALDWRRYFADATLHTLIDTALAHNRDLRVATLNVQQAQAQFRIREADRLPTVGLAANASRAPATGSGDLTNSFSVGLAISAWEIDFFGRLASLRDQALAQYLATREGRDAAQSSLVAAVAQGWLALQADEELLALTRQTLATREESARLMRLRFEAGASSELDWQQAVGLQQAALATLAQLQRQRALNENALALLLGQPLPPAAREALAARRLTAQPDLATLPAGLPSDLLTHRPDIRQAEQQLIAANAQIGAARAAMFPRISLTAQAGTASRELGDLFSGGSWGFTLAPSLLHTLFDAGRNAAQLDASRVGREIAVAQYEKTIQTAFREVSDALAGTETLRAQSQALQRQQDAEAARMRLAELRFQNGVASSLELLDAQRSLFAVQQSRVQVRLAQQQNQVLLYKALGGGTGQPGA
ncbi:efflux transporter outer membrane subunit [Acidovorax lacteus]